MQSPEKEKIELLGSPLRGHSADAFARLSPSPEPSGYLEGSQEPCSLLPRSVALRSHTVSSGTSKIGGGVCLDAFALLSSEGGQKYETENEPPREY